MADYLFPVPARVLREMLKHTTKPYTEDAATVSIMFDLDAENLRSVRAYSRIFGWTRKKVTKLFPILVEEALSWRNFNVKTPEKEGTTQGTTWVPKTGAKSSIYVQSDTTRVPPRVPLLTRKKECKTRVSNDTLVETAQNWNEFAKKTSLPLVRFPLSDKRCRAIRNRHPKLWPEIKAVYAAIRASEFLLGTDGGWRVTFDFVWCTRDGATKILEGQYNQQVSEKPLVGTATQEWKETYTPARKDDAK